MFGAIGFVAGVVILAAVWFPHSVVLWFVVSAVPGFVAYRLAQVPEGYSPSRGFGIFAGLWASLFWLPILVAIGTALKLWQ